MTTSDKTDVSDLLTVLAEHDLYDIHEDLAEFNDKGATRIPKRNIFFGLTKDLEVMEESSEVQEDVDDDVTSFKKGFVFRYKDRFFSYAGTYDSWNGMEFDDEGVVEVYPHQVMTTIYRRKPQR